MLNFIKSKLVKEEINGLNESREFNIIHGKYRVKYSEKHISKPMCLDSAKSFANIFGGKVIIK